MGKTVDDVDNSKLIDEKSRVEEIIAPTPTTPEEMASPANGRVGPIKLFCHLLLAIALRFWALCSTIALILLLTFWFYGGVGTLVLLHLAILGLAYNAQDMLLYYPDQPPQSRLFVDSPSTVGLAYENVYVTTRDGVRINMVLIKQPQHIVASAATVVFFHGNAGNIGHRLINVQALCTFCGVNVLMVEYRGYGKSRGKPSEAGLYLDGQAALDYIFTRSDINQQKLVVFGRSLGGAVAIRTCSVPYYASRIHCLVVENTFTSIPEMARSIFNVGVLQYLPEFCFKNKYLSRNIIDKITIPSLFLSGLQDNLVPPKQMHLLYELSASSLKRLVLFQDGTHNETWQSSGYYDTFNGFIAMVEKCRHGGSVPSAMICSVDLPFRDGGVPAFH